MTNKTTDADVAFIKALAELLQENDLTELEVKRDYSEDNSLNVRVSRAAPIAAAPVAMAAPAAVAPAPVAAAPAPVAAAAAEDPAAQLWIEGDLAHECRWGAGG